MINKMANLFVSLQIKGYYYRQRLRTPIDKVRLGKNVLLNKWTKFEGENRVGNNSVIHHSKIGFATYIGNDCKLVHADIGKYTSIASNVGIVAGTHPISEFISTSPVFYSVAFGGGYTYVDREYYKVYKYVDEEKNMLVKIGNDVWLGEGVKIIQGVSIGDGVIVAAYSVVTKNLDPYGVYAGCPARLVKRRYKDEMIEQLLKFEWWNQKTDWIKYHADSFRDKEKFMKLIEGEENGVAGKLDKNMGGV